MEAQLDRRIVIFILVSLGFITLPHINHIPISLIVFFYSLLLWRFAAIWQPQLLPKKWLIGFLIVTAIYQLYSLHQGVFGRDAGTSIFISALGLKLLELRNERDLYLVSYLAFIVASSQFLYSQNMLMLGYIFLVSCSIFAVLIAINTKKSVTKPMLKKMAVIVAQALPMTLLLFFLFPRIDAPDWLLFNKKDKAVSGLSDTLKPGSISQLGFSQELAFRVKFKGKRPPPEQLYWRGPVFSHTDGLTWTETDNRHFLRRMDKLKFSGRAYHYTIMMEPQDGPWIYALDMPTAFPKKLLKNGLFQLINPVHQGKRAEYKITSYSKFNTGKLTNTEYTDNTQLPSEPMPEVLSLVDQLKGGSDSPQALINAIFSHFRHNGFSYTLNPPVMNVNPIETFLFRARSGFCGHFATAFVYLLRVADIPARVVTGYQGGEWNKVGGFFEIKQSDAHAWAEVWLENRGWVRFDPTIAVAPDQFNQQQFEFGRRQSLSNTQTEEQQGYFYTWFNHSVDVWRNMDYRWQQWIINYRGIEASRFLSSFGLDDIKSIFYGLSGLILLAFGCLGWFILGNKKTAKDKELIVYQQFCGRLGKTGIVKLKGETAHDFSLRAKQLRPDLAGGITVITDKFVKLRYKKDPSVEDFKLFKKLVGAFKPEKSKHL